MVNGKVGIRKRLRLDTLCRIYNQDSALAGGKRARNLVPEVNMARRVDQVQDIFVAVERLVIEPNRTRLDGYPAFAFELHIVEHLLLDPALFDSPREFEQPVGKRAFPVVNMRNNRKIAYSFNVIHLFHPFKRRAMIFIAPFNVLSFIWKPFSFRAA